MATPQDPSAKETPREGGGEDEAGKSPEKKGEREGGKGVARGPGWFRSLLSGGRQSSSSDKDDFPPWEIPFKARVLRDTLRSLSWNKRRRFLRLLRAIPLEEGFVRIPEEELQEASASYLGDLLLSYYGETYALEVAAEALRAIDCDFEADWLLYYMKGKYSGYVEMHPHIQRNIRKKVMWSLEGVAITGDEIFCKGRKELLEIIERDLEFFSHDSCCGFIFTKKEFLDFWKAKNVPKQKSEILLNMIHDRGEATCCSFLEEVERRYPGSIEILLAAIQGSGKKLDQASSDPVVQPESSLFAEEGRSTMENPAAGGEESVVCPLCPSEMQWKR